MVHQRLIDLSFNCLHHPTSEISGFFDTQHPESYALPVIQITPEAARQIRQLTGHKGLEYGLRLFVEKGGCAGLSYGMNVAPAQQDDRTLEHDGVRLFLAADSVELLDGCTLDYEEELTHTGFKIINPKAKQTCGCGTSFEA